MAARRLAVGAWLAGLALCAFQIYHTRFVADLSAFLPAAPTAEQRFLVDQLRDGAISRVMLIGIEGSDAATRARVSNAMAQKLRGDSLFASASNGAATGFERERDLLLANRYALSPAVTPARFSVAGLRAAVGDTVDLLASPAGLMVKPLVTRDPTGEMLAILEQIRPPEGPRMVEGVWASPDGNRALLVARTTANGSDTDAQANAVASVERAFGGAVAGLERGDSLGLLLTGPGVFSVRARAMIMRDVERLALASMVIVAVLLLGAYRSPIALGLGLVPVVSGALAGIAAVSLGFGAVHGITLGFGTTLIGEAVDYSIYFFVQSERGEREWVASFWPTVRLGVLTSIAGFSALLFSGLPGLAQLGLYSIVGLIAAAAVTRFVLPALLPARFRIRDLSALGVRLESLLAAAPLLRRPLAALLVAATVVLALHRDTLWDRQLSSLNPIAPADLAIDAQLREGLGASDARNMIAVTGPSADAALQAAERIGSRLDELVAGGRISGYESPARFLPSLATQRARIESLPDAPELRARLKTALAQSPLRPERLEPFVADVAKARAAAPVTRETVKGTALDAALDGLLFRDASGRWTALLGLRTGANAWPDVDAVRRAIAQSGVEGAVLLDMKGAVERLYSGYFERALRMSAFGLAAIVVLLFAALRTPRRVARVMAPLVAGVLVVAACHALAGTRMSLLHLVGLLLVVAIGSNYALFFDRMAAAPDKSGARTLASLALANATAVASFGILALSSIPVLKAIGSTVALGALLTLLFSAVLSRVPFAHADPHPSRGRP
jgi:predicted exporter